MHSNALLYTANKKRNFATYLVMLLSQVLCLTLRQKGITSAWCVMGDIFPYTCCVKQIGLTIVVFLS